METPTGIVPVSIRLDSGTEPMGTLGITSQLLNWLSLILPILAILFIIFAIKNYFRAHGDRMIVCAGNKKMIYAAITIVSLLIIKFYLSIIGSVDPF